MYYLRESEQGILFKVSRYLDYVHELKKCSNFFLTANDVCVYCLSQFSEEHSLLL